MASESTQKPRRKWLKLTLGFIGLMAVFSIGYGLGSGNIGWSNNTATNLPSNLQYQSVEKIYDLLRNRFDGTLEEGKLVEGMKRGLVQATGDPYTEYLTAEQAKEFDQDLNGSFSGIGAELSKDGDSIVIVAPIDGFPAEKAGLKPKDIVAEVDGQSTYGKSVSEVVDKIRGPEGTDVTLRVIRNKSEDLTFKITRANITIPSVEYKILDGSIGYIKISRFSDDTAELVSKAATEFKQKNVKGVIVDVRGNPGGLLDASVDVASVWLPSGKTVLKEKRGDVTIKTYDSNGTATLAGIPTVVLIDEGSASASEILAGALKDNNAATLMGVKSYGKGSVQSIERLPDGSALKVTIARWYTPNGRNIDKEGIEPDTKVELQTNTTADGQLDAALQQLNQQ